MRKYDVKIIIRFCNFLLDMFAISFLTIITILILKGFLQSFQDYSLRNNRIITFILYFLYYFIFESSLSTTLGKLITKTKVVDQISLSKPSLLKIILRTLCRFIPFEGIAIFFSEKNRPLHDIISRTTVIYNC
jgi:uncharacterized RDD family membrane protein YckC